MDRINDFFEQINRISASLERIADALEYIADKQIPVESQVPESETLQEEPEPEEENELELLENFLMTKNLHLESISTPMSFDRVFDSISLFIGNRYEHVKMLLEKIKSNMASGMRFSLQVAKYPQEAISSMCQLCTTLHKNALLEEYYYQKSPVYLITGKVALNGYIQNLFTGNWLERYIFQVTNQILSPYKAFGISCHIFNNIKIRLKNGDAFELDIIALTDSTTYWIECKTGKYQQHIDKYSTFAKTKGFDKEHSFIVLVDTNKALCDSLSSLYSITAVNITDFQEIFKAQVTKDMSPLVYDADENKDQDMP